MPSPRRGHHKSRISKSDAKMRIRCSLDMSDRLSTQLLCLVGWLNAYLQSTAVWNVWEALGMFSVSTDFNRFSITILRNYSVKILWFLEVWMTLDYSTV